MFTPPYIAVPYISSTGSALIQIVTPPVRPETGWLQDAWQRFFGGPAPQMPVLPFAPVDATSTRGISSTANVRPPSNVVKAQSPIDPGAVTPLPANDLDEAKALGTGLLDLTSPYGFLTPPTPKGAYGPRTAFRHLVEASGEFAPSMSSPRGLLNGVIAQGTQPVRTAGDVTTAIAQGHPGAAALAALGLLTPPELGGEEIDPLIAEYHATAGKLGELEGSAAWRDQAHAALLQDRLRELSGQIAARAPANAPLRLPAAPGVGFYDVQLPDGSYKAIRAASGPEASQVGRVVRYQPGEWHPDPRNPGVQPPSTREGLFAGPEQEYRANRASGFGRP